MANNEVEKIDSLKKEREKCYEEVNNAKEEEEKQRETNKKMSYEIAELKKQQLQSTELEEEVILRKLMGEYDEISKNKEEQEERLEAIKYKNRELEDCIKQCDNDIDK